MSQVQATTRRHPDCVDVVVVGLGPVGAALGNLLGQLGLSVAIFERDPVVLEIPRAVGLDGETVRLLQTLGLAEEMLPRLQSFLGGQHLAPNGDVLHRRPAATGPGPQGWYNHYNFHQPDLEHVLRAGLRRFVDVTVATAHEVTEVRDDGDAVTVSVLHRADGSLSHLQAALVVGCDGARSTVRRRVGSASVDLGLHEPWIVADFVVHDEARLPPVTTQFTDPVSPITYIRVVGDRRRFEYRPRDPEHPERETRAEDVWSRVERWLGPADATLVRATHYVHHSLIAESWWRNRLVLAGDAAHQTPPFLGQGLCTGLRDVAGLGWRLHRVIKDGAPLGLLRSYESERVGQARVYVQAATEMARLLTSPDPDRIASVLDRAGKEARQAPPLGPGLHESDRLGGTLSAQPAQADGTRLDDVTGYRFAVVVDPAVHGNGDPLPGDLGIDTAVVPASGATREWLTTLQCDAVILRPDRYVYAATSGPAALGAALGRLQDAIRVEPAAENRISADRLSNPAHSR